MLPLVCAILEASGLVVVNKTALEALADLLVKIPALNLALL